MDKSKIKSIYSKQIFLNPDESPFVGSVSAFLGKFIEDGKEDLAAWLRVGDCHTIACIHKGDWDYTEDYIKKMRKLHNFIGDFINVLEDYKNGELETSETGKDKE